MIDERKKSDAIHKLEIMVNDFNNAFNYWREEYGLEVDLAWAYRDGKALEIKEITASIYKKKPVIPPELSNFKHQN